MGEVTGRLYPLSGERLWWEVVASGLPDWANKNYWTFRRRIDAIAFAARKGIRLEAE